MGETFYVAIADESSASWGSFQLDNLKVLGNVDICTFHNSNFSYKTFVLCKKRPFYILICLFLGSESPSTTTENTPPELGKLE